MSFRETIEDKLEWIDALRSYTWKNSVVVAGPTNNITYSQISLLNVADNDIDGDAFALLSIGAIQELIPTVGLRLKFQNAFNELVPKTSGTHRPSSDSGDAGEVIEADAAIYQNEESGKHKPSHCSSTNLKDNVVREHSKIFGYQRESAQLTDWQKVVNNSAYDLSRKDPNLLYERGRLKEMAEEKAREGYIFKKKSGSRSNRLEEEPKQKRLRYSQEDRRDKIAELSTEIEMVKKRISTKHNLISKANDMKDYQLCDKAQGEMRDLMREKGRLEKQLKGFQKKETKSKWYHQLKGNKECSSSCLPKVTLPSKNTAGSVDIRKLFAPKMAASATTTTSTTTASSPPSIEEISMASQTTATAIDTNSVTDASPQEDLLESSVTSGISETKDQNNSEERSGIPDSPENEKHFLA